MAPMAELLGFAFLNAKAFLVLSPLTLLPQKCVLEGWDLISTEKTGK